MQSAYGTKYGSSIPVSVFLERNPQFGDLDHFERFILLTLDYCLLLKRNDPILVFIGKDLPMDESAVANTRREVNQLIVELGLVDYPPKVQHFFHKGLRQISFDQQKA